MEHTKKQPPESSSDGNLPLARVHRWASSDRAEKTDGTADDEPVSENLHQRFKESPDEKKEDYAEFEDVKTRQEVDIGPAVLPGYSTTDDHLAPSGDECPNGHDSTSPEFSILQLNSPKQRVTESNVHRKEEQPCCHSSDTHIEPMSLSPPEIIVSNYSVIGGNAYPIEDIHEPAGFTEANHLEPRILAHEINLSGVLDDQVMTRSDNAANVNIISLPKSPQYVHGAVAAAQPINEQHYEILKFFPTSSTALPVMSKRETATQSDVIINPVKLPRSILRHDHSSTLPVRPVSGSLKISQYDSVYYSGASHLSFTGDPDPLMPPPSYSECVHQMSPPSFKLPHLASTKAHVETLPRRESANIFKTTCSQFRPMEVEYSKLASSGTSILDDDIATFAKSRTNVLAALTDSRPGILDSDHQLLAFISCLFCWPIGLVAIYYSNMCQMLKAEGNYVQAQVYARQAFIISSLGLCSGSLSYIIIFIYQRIL